MSTARYTVPMAFAIRHANRTGRYKHDFGTFAEYCRLVWGISASWGYRLMSYADILEDLGRVPLQVGRQGR